MVKVYVEKGLEVYVTTKLSSVLSRVNLIYNCLPEELHFYMDNVKENVNNALKSLDCILNISGKRLSFLDMVSLYTELSDIYNDLNECSLLTFCNCDITFAFNNVGIIMEKMAEYDSVFRCCYQNNAKKRIYTI
jgi:hypothetical protein